MMMSSGNTPFLSLQNSTPVNDLNSTRDGGDGGVCGGSGDGSSSSLMLHNNNNNTSTGYYFTTQNNNNNGNENGPVKAKIMAHPHYHCLLSAYVDCQKIGAPPEVVARLEEVCSAAVAAGGVGRGGGGCIGEDPTLDQFMEACCEMLSKYEQELSQPLKEAIYLCWEQETRLLLKSANVLLAFLEDRERLERGRGTVNSLEKQIRDAAYRAEDVIEFLQMKEYVVFTKNDLEREKKDLQRVIEDIQAVVEEAMKMKNETGKDGSSSGHLRSIDEHFAGSSKLPTSGKKIMVGFDDDLLEIKERLCGGSSNLQIISIVGMGGIGKTTLARNVYDDRLIEYHFDTRAWVTISQEYSVNQILLGLLPYSTTENYLQHRANLEEKVYKNLKGRRYLAVMDDMWDKQVWDDLRRVFPNDNNGSRIVLTTRLANIAAYANSHHHEMTHLNEVQSWDLLRENVFGKESCPPELVGTGKMIAENCGGLPLAIVVIAGILSKCSRSKVSWMQIADNVNSEITTSDGNVSKILSLSYDNLPHHLRACFHYMAVFPEDYKIRVSRLVKLWIAEGFIKPGKSGNSLEEVAEDYLEDLAERSLVLASRLRHKINYCTIHDLLRELCIRKAQEEKFLLVVDKGLNNESKNQRRLVFPKAVFNDNGGNFGSHVRSVLGWVVENSWCLNSEVLNFRALKVLDAYEVYVHFVPREIVDLCHLRYLAIWSGHPLPESLSSLQNLQTLIVRGFYEFFRFNIWKMMPLRHMIFRGDGMSLIQPCQGWVLENLRTISGVKNFSFNLAAIRRIPNVNKLGIVYDYTSEYLLDNLVQMKNLEKLNIFFYNNMMMTGRPPLFSVDFAFPSTLTKLTLKGTKLAWRMMSIVHSLPNLEVLKLRAKGFVGQKWESVDEEFPRLKYLLIEWAEIEEWTAESWNFPILEELCIRHCWK